MAIKRIKVVSVYVSDQDMALDFYTGKLGFEKQSDQTYGEGYRWVEVGIPDEPTVISLVKPYPGQPTDKIGAEYDFVFATDDLDGTYRELSDRGVKFTVEPGQQTWGRKAAYFADQDGNTFLLVER